MANPTLLEMPIARDGAKNSIPSTTSPTTGLLSQQYGWQDINSMPVQQGGKAPSRLDFNGVLNLLSNILFYCQKGWQFEWDSSQSYYSGCIVKDISDGKMYMCINDVTSTTAPHSDTTNWKLWDLSMLANYLPLTGGYMSAGNITIRHDDNNSRFNIFGAKDSDHGASITLFGEGYSTDPDAQGVLALFGAGNNALAQMIFKPDGSLLLYPDKINAPSNYNDLGGSAIVAKSLSADSGYVKNDSGFMLQYGKIAMPNANTNYDITFPISFTYAPALCGLASHNASLGTYPTIIRVGGDGTAVAVRASVGISNTFYWMAYGY